MVSQSHFLHNFSAGILCYVPRRDHVCGRACGHVHIFRDFCDRDRACGYHSYGGSSFHYRCPQ